MASQFARSDDRVADQFARYVTNLNGQVKSFQMSLAGEDAEELVRDADICVAALDKLYSYAKDAERQKINLNQYYPHLVSIEGNLLSAKNQIQQKMDRAEVSKRSLWKQSLGSVNVALHLASGLTYLARRRV
jgi:hypothetical protein